MRQWQNAVDAMRRRDDEINAIGEKYAAARQVRVERTETLAQNVARLKMQKNDNQEVTKEEYLIFWVEGGELKTLGVNDSFAIA